MKRLFSLALLGSAALLIPMLLARGQTSEKPYGGIQDVSAALPPGAALAYPATSSYSAASSPGSCCTKPCSARSESCAKTCAAKASCCGKMCCGKGECCKGQCCCGQTCKNKNCAAAAAHAADEKMVQELITILNDTDSQEMVVCTASVLGKMGKGARPALPALLRSMERLGIVKDGERKAEKQAMLQQIGNAIDGILEKSGVVPMPSGSAYYYPTPAYNTLGSTPPLPAPVPTAPPAPIAPPSVTPSTPSGPSTAAPSAPLKPVASW
jgi:hypothetical protein